MGSLKRLLDALLSSSAEIVQELSSIYGAETIRYQKPRYGFFLNKFLEHYPESTNPVVVRAPGRVNLIGEHTDYNGLPVMPMSINRDILVLASSRPDNQVHLKNLDDRFPDSHYEIASQIPPFAKGEWGNYSKAGVQTILDYVASKAESQKPPAGMNLLVYSDLPSTGGLSSSSALVVANALATVHLNHIQIEKALLADLLAKGERYVGTEGGGMDQAASLLGERGQALKIDFFPLRVKHVPLPTGYKVMVVNSLVKAEKTRAAMEDYNRRPRECRLIVALLNKVLRRLKGENCHIDRLADLNKSNLDDYQLQTAVDQALPPGSLGLGEISRKLETSVQQIEAEYLTTKEGRILSQPLKGFPLRQRYQHVLTEAKRVEEAALALEHGQISRVGDLMFESHRSCAEDFEISCPELDNLVEIARDAGAVGARLTGAGFGGCVVALVQDSELDRFTQIVKRRYFQEYLKIVHPEIVIESRDFSDLILTCEATKGADRVFQASTDCSP